ncbi:MAG: hypothetical protein R2810_04105 [Flavobacteriales bacterium]
MATSNTVGDETWDANCNCTGGLVDDCLGVPGGSALPGTAWRPATMATSTRWAIPGMPAAARHYSS